MTDQPTSNVLRFKRKRRPHAKIDVPAQIFALPTSRHVRIVEFISREMRKQPTPDAAEQYLISHLEIEWSRLAGIGVDRAEIERSCRAFAVAAWAIVLRGCDHDEGVA